MTTKKEFCNLPDCVFTTKCEVVSDNVRLKALVADLWELLNSDVVFYKEHHPELQARIKREGIE